MVTAICLKRQYTTVHGTCGVLLTFDLQWYRCQFPFQSQIRGSADVGPAVRDVRISQIQAVVSSFYSISPQGGSAAVTLVLDFKIIPFPHTLVDQRRTEIRAGPLNCSDETNKIHLTGQQD